MKDVCSLLPALYGNLRVVQISTLSLQKLHFCFINVRRFATDNETTTGMLWLDMTIVLSLYSCNARTNVLCPVGVMSATCPRSYLFYFVLVFAES